MTQTVAALVWFAGLVGWYIIRHPFERKAKKIGVRKSLLDWRERGLLAVAFLGLFVIPGLYVLTGFPASLDRPFIPAIAWLGLVPLVAALMAVSPQPRRSRPELVDYAASPRAARAGQDRRLSPDPASDVFFVFPFGSRANVAVAELVCGLVRGCGGRAFFSLFASGARSG